MKKIADKLLLVLLVTSVSGCMGQKTSSSSVPSSDTSSTSEPAKKEVLSLTFLNNPTVPGGVKLFDNLFVDLEAKYEDKTEIVSYSTDDGNSNLAFELYKEGSDDNIINEVLEKDTTYKIVAKYKDAKAITYFTTDAEVYKLDDSNLAFTCEDLSSAYSLSKGDVNILVIPVKLNGSWVDEIEPEHLDIMDDMYFGDDELSFVNYYKDASFDQLHFGGFISDVYEETDFTSNDIQNNSVYRVRLINNAVSHVIESMPEVNWRQFDLNQDGAIDNLHLVTNFNPTEYMWDTHQSAWGTNLWPHMTMLDQHSSDLDKPVANTYSFGCFDHMLEDGGSAITPIHEQGHIFGLQDYYDYGGYVDYIGGFDMQSNNVLDWNSFSKLSVGWANAYVVNSECTITMGSASKTGNCLIVPANGLTYNKSAFDEYFLIELLSFDGNNKKFPETWQYIFGDDSENKYGVRMYHVDARLFTMSGNETDDPVEGFMAIDDNCYEYSYYYSYFKKLADFKLLSVIQRGGEDTFGNYSGRHYLNESDLFKEGDIFTFDEYSHFLSKKRSSKAKMDNGEYFPYTIEFVRMSADSVTIKITEE